MWRIALRQKGQTLIEPTDFFLFASTNPRAWLPFFFCNILQVLANVSSVCAVMISSQSFHLVVEKDIAVIGGSFRDAMGTDRDVAFLVREPT